MKLDKSTVLKITGILTFCILLYCALQNTAAVKGGIGTVMSYLNPFIVGGAIAFIINVPMRFIERHLFPKAKKLDKLRRPLALILALLAIAAIIVLVCIIVIPQIADTVSTLTVNIPQYMDNAKAYVNKILEKYPELQEEFQSYTGKINWQSVITSVTGWVSNGVVSTINVAGSAISGIVSAVVGFVFAIYILLQKERLGRQVRMIAYSLLPEKAADKFFKISNMTSDTFSKFLSGQCLEACILGSMFAIVLAVFRMPYVALISVLIAFTALIPIVGAFIGCVIGAFLIFMISPVKAVWFVVIFLVLQQIEGNFIYPKVVGSSVGLPAIWVLAVVTVGGKLMGVIGMLVMIPLSSVLYAIFREFIYNKLKTKTERVQKMFFGKSKPAAENVPSAADQPQNNITAAQSTTKSSTQTKKRTKRK